MNIYMHQEHTHTLNINNYFGRLHLASQYIYRSHELHAVLIAYTYFCLRNLVQEYLMVLPEFLLNLYRKDR